MRPPVFLFAYGSNMSRNRLWARAPSARFLGRARLDNYRLRFHKRSVDGSAKATVQPSADGSCVWGVVFECLPEEKKALDAVEGLGSGYNEQAVRVQMDDGNEIEALLYIADVGAIDDSLLPYTWYLDFVVTGASEHGLPDWYLEDLRQRPAVSDPDMGREALNRATLYGDEESA